MSLLVRKINKAKWMQVDLETSSDVGADAITNCLRTTKNCLSVWQIENEEELDQAVLALASAQDHLETFDVIILEGNSEHLNEIEIVTSNGNTPIQMYSKKHRDLTKLTFSKLEKIKNHIVEKINEKKIYRFTRGEIKNLLEKAIGDSLLRIDQLKEDVQKKFNPE